MNTSGRSLEVLILKGLWDRKTGRKPVKRGVVVTVVDTRFSILRRVKAKKASTDAGATKARRSIS
jgi:hypothetical protein